MNRFDRSPGGLHNCTGPRPACQFSFTVRFQPDEMLSNRESIKHSLGRCLGIVLSSKGEHIDGTAEGVDALLAVQEVLIGCDLEKSVVYVAASTVSLSPSQWDWLNQAADGEFEQDKPYGCDGLLIISID